MGFSVARFSGGTYSPKSLRDHQLPLVKIMIMISLIILLLLIMMVMMMNIIIVILLMMKIEDVIGKPLEALAPPILVKVYL